MDDETERMRILDLIEGGQISAEEGMQRLQSLRDERASTAPAAESRFHDGGPANVLLPTTPAAPVWSADGTHIAADRVEVLSSPEFGASEASAAGIERTKRWWVVPFWISVGITVLGGVWMNSALRSAGGVGLEFLCAAVPFALGVLLLALGYASRTMPWLHLRIRQAPGERPQSIVLGLPLPLGLASWFLNSFGPMIPGLRDQPLDAILQAVRSTANSPDPIYIQVDGEDRDEKVEIFIG